MPQKNRIKQNAIPTRLDASARLAIRRVLCASGFSLVLFAFAPSTFAQEQPKPVAPAQTSAAPPAGEVIDDEDVLRIDSNLVSIPAIVTESNGRAVPDLKLEDFDLRIDGQSKPIGELNRADVPVLLAVLFDNSSSLSQAREFEKQAATRFFQRIVRPIDRAAIYSVSTVPVLSRPLTNNVPVLLRTIESFAEPEGATALFDTIAVASDYLRPNEGRKVIVIVSDGNDTISDATFDQALQRALKAGCQIYVVGTGDIEHPNLTDTIARKRLQVFAAQTGGALYVPRAVEDLDAAFEQIFKDISQQYVLTYYPTDDPADGRFRSIEVRVKTRPTLRVRAREGYYASVGQARVRPRRANGAGEMARNGKKDNGHTTNNQAASLDPLYTQTLSAGNTARDNADTSSVSFKTKKAATANTTTKARGPQEFAEPNATEMRTPINISVGSDTSSNNSNDAVDARTIRKPVTLSTTNAQTETSLKQSTSTLEAAPEPAPARSFDETATETRPNEAESTESSSKTSERVPVSSGVLNGQAKTLPTPLYPNAAKLAGVKGKVMVEVEINEEGEVVAAKAASGPALLQQAAVLAARQARFSPTYLSGQPVRIKGVIIYSFL